LADVGFTDAGLTHHVCPENLQPDDLPDRYKNIRFFPNGTRNCYTIRYLPPGGKYLVRAYFGYGNYDTLNWLPTFDLYIGVNYWTIVRVVNSSTAYIFEAITVSPANYLQVCLVNKGLGTPFIYGRIWQRYEEVPTWTVPYAIDGVVIKNTPNDTYGAPSAVMRSVSTPLNSSRMDLYWNLDSSMDADSNTKYLVVLYFAEVEILQPEEFRQFDVLLDDNITLADAFSPQQMLTTVLRALCKAQEVMPSPSWQLSTPSHL
jgi:hypothetical protein